MGFQIWGYYYFKLYLPSTVVAAEGLLFSAEPPCLSIMFNIHKGEGRRKGGFLSSFLLPRKETHDSISYLPTNFQEVEDLRSFKEVGR